ncbi:MAG: hypothetical protein WAN48_15775 [Actinomycetes bacterium]
MRWRGRADLSPDVRASLGLARGERVLAVAHDPDGRPVVATDRDLLLQLSPPEYQRIGWETIDKATYVEGVLRVTRVDSHGVSGAGLRIPLPDPGELPVVVRDRVTSSIVVSQPVTVADGVGIRVVARRRPDHEGLTWSYVLDRGVDASDPETVRAAREAVAAVRLDAGIDG